MQYTIFLFFLQKNRRIFVASINILIMKKLFTLFVLLTACTALFAQKLPQDTSYKSLKEVYSPANYVKSTEDPYSLFWTGAGSFLIPGMGQLIMKENSRGWAFLGSAIGLGLVNGILTSAAASLTQKNKLNGFYTIPETNKGTVTGLMVGAAVVGVAQLGASIWSCIDAVNIAKVKNQYYQDAKGQHAFSATVYPSMEVVSNGNGLTLAPGMTFALNF